MVAMVKTQDHTNQTAAQIVIRVCSQPIVSIVFIALTVINVRSVVIVHIANNPPIAQHQAIALTHIIASKALT